MRTIAHVSDLHFGRHDSDIVEGLLSSIASYAPDLVVVSGDLTQRAHGWQFIEARNFLNQLQKPLLVVPGNHDVPLFNLFKRFTTPFAGYGRYIGPLAVPDCFYLDDEIAVLGLNTARRLKWKEGRVSLDQIGFIREKFSPLPSNVWKIVVTHHPIAVANDEFAHSVAERAELALEAIAASHVHLLLSGHHHHAVSGESAVNLVHRRSVLIVYAGTAVSTRTRGGHENSYNILRLVPSGATVRTLEWRGKKGFQETAITFYVLKDNRWHASECNSNRGD